MNDEQTPPAPLNPVSHLLIQLSRIFAAVPQTSEDERSACIRALVEMARFVREAARSTQDTGLWNAQSRLSDLAYTLQDLDAGRVAPVLQRTKRKGTPPDSSLSWMKRARVLVAMNALQKADPDLKKLGAAARHIAEKYPGLRRLMTRGKSLPGTILHWRRELEEAKPDTFLRQVFRADGGYGEFRS